MDKHNSSLPFSFHIDDLDEVTVLTNDDSIDMNSSVKLNNFTDEFSVDHLISNNEPGPLPPTTLSILDDSTISQLMAMPILTAQESRVCREQHPAVITPMDCRFSKMTKDNTIITRDELRAQQSEQYESNYNHSDNFLPLGPDLFSPTNLIEGTRLLFESPIFGEHVPPMIPQPNGPHMIPRATSYDNFDPVLINNMSLYPKNPVSFHRLKNTSDAYHDSNSKSNSIHQCTYDDTATRTYPKNGVHVPISSFLRPTDRHMVSDFTNAIIDEMEVTFFGDRDSKKGTRGRLPVGFPGMACRHCKEGAPGFRKGCYFPSSIKTISDSKKTLYSIHKHLMKCSSCPEETKRELNYLFSAHLAMCKSNNRHGNQRAFFRQIWLKLHPPHPDIPKSKMSL